MNECNGDDYFIAASKILEVRTDLKTVLNVINNDIFHDDDFSMIYFIELPSIN